MEAALPGSLPRGQGERHSPCGASKLPSARPSLQTTGGSRGPLSVPRSLVTRPLHPAAPDPACPPCPSPRNHGARQRASPVPKAPAPVSPGPRGSRGRSRPRQGRRGTAAGGTRSTHPARPVARGRERAGRWLGEGRAGRGGAGRRAHAGGRPAQAPAPAAAFPPLPFDPVVHASGSRLPVRVPCSRQPVFPFSVKGHRWFLCLCLCFVFFFSWRRMSLWIWGNSFSTTGFLLWGN